MGISSVGGGFDSSAASFSRAVQNANTSGAAGRMNATANGVQSAQEHEDSSASILDASDTFTFTQSAEDSQENAIHSGFVRNRAANETDETGATDETGVADETGETGATDETGETGATDETGETGATDETGETGAADETGETGAADETGEAGGPDGPDDPKGPKGPKHESEAEAAARMQKLQQEHQEAMKIFAQMMADRQKWLMQLFKIWQDTQTSMMEMVRDTMVNKANSFNSMYKAWTKAFRGE
ncbi:MAG: collagen-like protein [bacterium]|nr:collagen-like protein [bacterium]